LSANETHFGGPDTDLSVLGFIKLEEKWIAKIELGLGPEGAGTGRSSGGFDGEEDVVRVHIYSEVGFGRFSGFGAKFFAR
jgi:hypothetical protein